LTNLGLNIIDYSSETLFLLKLDSILLGTNLTCQVLDFPGFEKVLKNGPTLSVQTKTMLNNK